MVRKYLKVIYATGITLSLVSVLVFAGITATNQKTGTAAYGAMTYDKGNNMSNNSTTTMTANEIGMTSLVAVGNIANVQLDSNGSPAWIQSGIWVMRASFNQSTNQPESVWLMAKFVMVKPDGTARHKHEIYGFQATEFTAEQNNRIHVVKGTANVTMKDGPVSEVPVTIKIFNGSVIGVLVGPDKVDSHFGSNPIYGTLSERSAAKMMQMAMGGNQTSPGGEQGSIDAGDNAVAIARQFILAKLPSLGIEINNELDLHTDMLVHVSENEFHLDYSVLDTTGQSHDGHIEIVNGEVTVANLDGESIL